MDWGQGLFASALALLAFGPILWLINTWRDPAFDSHGLFYFVVVAALAVWSLSSPRRARVAGDERFAIVLLAATALARLAGQLLAIDTIGALALVIDVYALGRLAGLSQRTRALSPFWLAAAFVFALPLERIVQRTIGYVLQDVSADGACAALSLLFGEVRCAGVRISVDGADVLVDLPCSGARAIIVFGFVFTILAALTRPRGRMAVLGVGLTLLAAGLGNVLRITLLAGGVAIGPQRLGFDIMSQPWHDLAGLIALGATAPSLIVWARCVKTHNSSAKTQSRKPFRPRLWRAFMFFCVAAAIVCAPRRPVDVAPRDVGVAAPERIADFRASSLPLSARERAYFEQYGGAAVKAAYGPYALMLARTTSPLRHLHAPDECLRGLGFRVAYLGMSFAPLASAHYRAVAPDGRAYRVAVSFLSDRGERTASVSEAVWLWLADRSSVWTAVQRIVPEPTSAAEQAAFDAGVFAALDQAPFRQFGAAGGEHARQTRHHTFAWELRAPWRFDGARARRGAGRSV